jgi:hypothetical protein
VNTRSLYLGLAGSGNNLSIANGATVRATNLVVGLSEQSTNNWLSVSSASLIVTNAAGTSRIELRSGALALTNATVRTATLLLSTNAEVVGTGTIAATAVTNSGALSPGNPAGQLNIGGNVTLKSSSALHFELGGYNPGVTRDFLNISNTIALGGTLTVRFINGFERALTNGATFTLMTAGLITGSFNNATNGSRLVTADGLADFLITYSGGNLVLSQPGLDFDNDGMPNWWEFTHGLNPHAPGDASLDSDGDGLTNAQEYRAGTDPMNPASNLRITSVILQTSDVRVAWTAVGGKSYVVQSSGVPSLTNFTDISPPLAVSGAGESTTNFLDVGAALPAPARYYRVRLAP